MASVHQVCVVACAHPLSHQGLLPQSAQDASTAVSATNFIEAQVDRHENGHISILDNTPVAGTIVR